MDKIFGDEFKRTRGGITFRHILAAKLYVFCDAGCVPYTEDDDFFYEYLHQYLLCQWNLQ